MKGVVISVFVMLAMFQFLVKTGHAAVTCQEVSTSLAACIPYLTNKAGAPSAACCSGVGNLQNIAVTTADKQAACNCAKDAAGRIPDINENAAASLPAKCNVQINFPISKNTNCQDIH